MFIVLNRNFLTSFSMSFIGDSLHLKGLPAAIQDHFVVTEQPNAARSASACDRRACLKHVSHVWPAEANLRPWHFLTPSWEGIFEECDRCCSTSSPCSGRESKRWKELRLCLSDPVFARETTGKLMWHSVLEPARAAGKGEWALSFFEVGWKKQAPTLWMVFTLEEWTTCLAAAVWKVLQSAWLSADSGLALRPSTNTRNLVCGTMQQQSVKIIDHIILNNS